jgi:crotonobetaine/carnitine-CoA ligase
VVDTRFVSPTAEPLRCVGAPGQQMTVPEVLALRADATPDELFVRFQGDEVTFGQALARAERAAGGLSAIGIGKGDMVALMLANSLAFLDLWFGAALLGAVIVPVNTHLRGDGLRYIVEHCDATVAVVDADLTEPFVAAVPRGVGPGRRYVHGAGGAPGFSALEELLAGAHATAQRARLLPSDLASVLYTSGTTGLPKGVMCSHNSYAAAALEYVYGYVRMRSDDVLFTCLPLFHVNAQALSAMPSLLTGRPWVMSARFSASRFFEQMREHEVTVFNYIGAMLTILLKQPEREDDAANPLRLTAGSSAPAEQWTEFERRFAVQIVEIYGLTETAGVCLASPPDDVRVGCCGVPVSWSEVQIQRPDGSEAAPDEPGEFVIRSTSPNTMFQGYYKNAEATAAAVREDWFHSGDRGSRGADGYFRFIDRLKDSIRRRGENISSYEVEQTVNSHPSVTESAAVGVPSELGEEEVMIVVVPREGHQLDPAELVEFCAARMAAFMVPRYVSLCAELPKTPTEKIQKFALRERGVVGAWDRLGTAVD